MPPDGATFVPIFRRGTCGGTERIHMVRDRRDGKRDKARVHDYKPLSFF
jgi:hypothetical protein